MTALFLSLARQDSLSFQEMRVAYRLKIELQSLGFEVIEDGAGAHYGSECGNLYGYRKGTAGRDPVLFSAHMDTVAPGLAKKPQLKDGRIESDGTTVLGADDICGIVEILEGIRAAKEDPKGCGDIEVLFTIGEEAYGQGAKVFDFSRVRSSEAYVLDMSGPPGAAARKAPSIIGFEVEVTGKAAHAGFAPEEGRNALQAAAKAIARIPQGHVSAATTLNVGRIEGGTADNIIASQIRCSGEVRSFDHEEAVATIDMVKKIFNEESDSIGAKVNFDSHVYIRAYETAEEAPVCRCFLRACRQLGLPGELRATHGGSDNNVFFQKGLSGIVLSCGMYGTHSTEEYTSVEDLAQGARLVAAIIGQRQEEIP
ncbi:MAG: M20/M25/M40 family metallo-hydrolase [Firmicutes bacterium]|nr:M20/M25/M40 family metallo-hydrolase [Bacillota bacterium]